MNVRVDDKDILKRKYKLYAVNDNVYVKNIQLKIWQKGKIVKVLSHSTYLVQLVDTVKFVHVNDIRSNPYNDDTPINISEVITSNEKFLSDTDCLENNNPIVSKPDVITTQTLPVESNTLEVKDKLSIPSSPNSTNTPKTYAHTRSGRIIKPPVKLNL